MKTFLYVYHCYTQCLPLSTPETWNPTACSVKDKTRNGHQNTKRNPNQNDETIVQGLFSFEI